MKVVSPSVRPKYFSLGLSIRSFPSIVLVLFDRLLVETGVVKADNQLYLVNKHVYHMLRNQCSE